MGSLTARWIVANCRLAKAGTKLAMPHVEYVNPETMERETFDVSIEELGKATPPKNWHENMIGWDEYKKALIAFYGEGEDWSDLPLREIQRRLYKKIMSKDRAPVWDGEELKLVPWNPEPVQAWLGGLCKFSSFVVQMTNGEWLGPQGNTDNPLEAIPFDYADAERKAKAYGGEVVAQDKMMSVPRTRLNVPQEEPKKRQDSIKGPYGTEL